MPALPLSSWRRDAAPTASASDEASASRRCRIATHVGSTAMATQTSDSVIQFGVPLDASAPLFFGCLAAGIGLVYLFCRQKFGERVVTENKDYVYQLMPRQLATRDEYSKGFLIYFGTM